MKPIFVGGCGRSGTTLLAALLAGHPRVVAPPEATFFLQGLAASRREGREDLDVFAREVAANWRFRLWEMPKELLCELAAVCGRPAEVMAGLASVYARQVGEEGVDRWVDHLPMNIGYAATLFEQFGTASLVHVVRDPRAVIASVLPLDWGPSSARAGARWWLSWIGMGLVAEAAYPDRVVRVEYESLVRDPAGSLERLCPRIGLEYTSGMADLASRTRLPAYTHSQHALVGGPLDPTRIDAWKSKLSEREISTIESELRNTVELLGYDRVNPAPTFAGESSGREFLGSALRTTQQRWRHRKRIQRGLRHQT